MDYVWQISAGQPGRYYTELFLKYDIMLIGPGNPGLYKKEVYDSLAKQGFLSAGIARQIYNFCTQVKNGDVVLLRVGKKAEAIGLIEKESYFWTQDFNDVVGWDLQHAQRVIWQHHLTELLKQIQEKNNLFYYRGSTFTKTWKPLNQLKDLLSQCKTRDLKPLV